MSYQEISAQSRERDIWVRGPPEPCVSEGHKMSKKRGQVRAGRVPQHFFGGCQ